MVKIIVMFWLLWSSATALADARDWLLETELLPQRVYVQSQSVYRMRFYQGVDVRDIHFSGPSTRLADILPIGGERVFEAERAGRRYRVHERSYAVTPFASGNLTLSGGQVSGRLAGQQPLQLQAATQTLVVMPAATVDGPWLPARAVTLSETWSSPLARLRQGLPVARSIRIEAEGATAAQIPEVTLAIPGMRVYAGTAHLQDRVSGGVQVGIREQTFNLLPLQSGVIEIPELRLAWWNILRDAPSSARLPGYRLQLAMASDAAPAHMQSHRPLARHAAPGWPWYGAAAGISLGLVWLGWRQRAAVLQWRRLRVATQGGDVIAVRNALLVWSARIWPANPPATLAALAALLHDPQAQQVLGDLECALYGRTTAKLQAGWLAAAVRQVQRSARAAGRRTRWHNGQVCKQGPQP